MNVLNEPFGTIQRPEPHIEPRIPEASALKGDKFEGISLTGYQRMKFLERPEENLAQN